MSRLKEYITESNLTLASAIEGIKKNCKPFLKDMRGSIGTLVRMQGDARRKPILFKNIRKERNPLDTQKEIHTYADEWFNKKFGWRARSNVIFCWGRPFGDITFYISSYYLVFPVGKYKYVWSPEVKDLTEYLNADKEFFRGQDINKNILLPVIEKLLNDAEYTNKNIRRAVSHDNEIMINTKSAYMISTLFLRELDKELDMNWQGIRR